ncbi:hypothetical protein [Helicobacter cetorum]|nr:hypothetical protein [Helicobacter cetorum]
MQNFEIYKKLESESTTMEEKARRLVILFYASILGSIVGIITPIYKFLANFLNLEKLYVALSMIFIIGLSILVTSIAREILDEIVCRYRDKYLVKKYWLKVWRESIFAIRINKKQLKIFVKKRKMF